VVAECHIVAVNSDILTRFAVNDVCIGNGCLSTSEKMVDLLGMITYRLKPESKFTEPVMEFLFE